MRPQEVDAALAAIGATVERLADAKYALGGVVVQRGVSAFNVNTVIGADHAPVIGALFVNAFPDGGGELIQSKGDGSVQFIYYTSAAFTNPGAGPFTVYIADGGTKDEDPPHHIHPGPALSDKVHSLGDFEGTHTEIYLQFVEQAAVVVPPAVPPAAVPILVAPIDESLRRLAWRMRGVDFNADAALYLVARGLGLGDPLTGEFEFLVGVIPFVAQCYSGGILYCVRGDWGRVQMVSWL